MPKRFGTIHDEHYWQKLRHEFQTLHYENANAYSSIDVDRRTEYIEGFRNQMADERCVGPCCRHKHKLKRNGG